MLISFIAWLLLSGLMYALAGSDSLAYARLNAAVMLVSWLVWKIIKLGFGMVKDIASDVSKTGGGARDELEGSVAWFASSAKLSLRAWLLLSLAARSSWGKGHSFEPNAVYFACAVLLSAGLLEWVACRYMEKSGKNILLVERARYLRSNGTLARRLVISGAAAAAIYFMPEIRGNNQVSMIFRVLNHVTILLLHAWN